MNNIQMVMTRHILKDYDQLFLEVGNFKTDTFLPSSTTGRCRFCKQSLPNVTFNKRAHAISELIGNHHLLSNYECDSCNSSYSKLEYQFSQYMLFYNTVFQIVGKRKPPVFQPYRNQPSSIFSSNGVLNIRVYQGDSIMHKINWCKKLVTLYGNRTYIPIDVYRCLLKMALTVMPETEMQFLNDSLDFLNKVTDMPNIKKICYFKIYGGGINVFGFPAVMLYKRKPTSSSNVPAYLFGLAYGNFFFEMPIIGCSLDAHLQNTTYFDLPVIPTIADGNFPIMQDTRMLDLSSTQKVIKEPVKMSLHFEYAQGKWLAKWWTILAYYITEPWYWIKNLIRSTQ